MSPSMLIYGLAQRNAEKFVKNLFGENDVDAVLQRLDRLTLDEARRQPRRLLRLSTASSRI